MSITVKLATRLTGICPHCKAEVEDYVRPPQPARDCGAEQVLPTPPPERFGK
jgi:hypothetical protein